MGTPGETPVPHRLTVCGLSKALSVIVRAPLSVPVARGVKVTLRVQLAPGGKVVLHSFVCAKSPLATTLLMLSQSSPLLFKVRVLGALVVP